MDKYKAIQLKTPIKIAADIPTSSILWCYITVSVGWPQDQLIKTNCVEH